ncbi:MAG: Hsp20/alpha crystallin family protein [Pseudobdellovibrionaceae bacterium]
MTLSVLRPYHGVRRSPAKHCATPPSSSGLGAFSRDIESLLDGFLTPFASSAPIKSGRMDIAETESAYEIHVEVPGYAEDDIHLSLEGDALTLEGTIETSSEDKPDDGKTWHRIERQQGAFKRVLKLPEDADASKIDATLKNGILFVTIEKAKEMKSKTKEIKIKSV